MFSGEELLGFAERATYIAVNDYEGKMLEEKTGKSLADLAKRENLELEELPPPSSRGKSARVPFDQLEVERGVAAALRGAAGARSVLRGAAAHGVLQGGAAACLAVDHHGDEGVGAVRVGVRRVGDGAVTVDGGGALRARRDAGHAERAAVRVGVVGEHGDRDGSCYASAACHVVLPPVCAPVVGVNT